MVAAAELEVETATEEDPVTASTVVELAGAVL